MSFDDRERIQAELLEALYKARKRVEWLESALAHNSALLGGGIEPASTMGAAPPDLNSIQSVLSYLEMEAEEDDLSNYLGIEGDDITRPRISQKDEAIKPVEAPKVPLQVGQLAFTHPDDMLSFSAASLLGEPEEAPIDLSSAQVDSASLGGLIPVEEDACGADPKPSLPVQASDALIRATLALQAINDGIWDWNLRTGEVWQSERWTRILGNQPDDTSLPLEAISRRLHPEDAEKCRNAFISLLDGHTSRINLGVRIHNTTPRVWALLRAVCLKEDGVPIRITAAISDISDHRENRLAFKGGEEQFRSIAEDSADLIARFDRQGCFLYASPNINRYVPTTRRAVIGKRFRDLNVEGDVEFFEENLMQAFELGLPIQVEVNLVSPLVGEFVADCRFWPDFGPDEEVLSVTAQLRDMTFLRRMSNDYKALFNSMMDGFVLFEHIPGSGNGKTSFEPEDFTATAMNPAFARMAGLDPGKDVGRSLDVLMKSDGQFWAGCLSRAMREKSPTVCTRRLVESGRMFEISTYSTDTSRIACIVRDITEIRAIERELRLNEARFAALYAVTQMDDATEDEVAHFVLEKAVELTGSRLGLIYLGRGDNNAPPKYWHNLPPSTDPAEGDSQAQLEVRAKILTLKKAEIVNEPSNTLRYIKKGLPGVQRYMIAPLVENGKTVCVAAVSDKSQDYTESDLRQLEMFLSGMWFLLRRRWSVQDLHLARDQAEAANQAKSQFLANVSHELRTPLNGILGMLQLLQMGKLDQEQKDLLETANNSGRTLLRIISDILDFSRIEAGRFELSPQVFDPVATIRSTLDVFLPQIEQKGLSLEIEMAPDIPGLVVGDDARLRQILLNLVGNAVKFTEKGKIRVECSLLPNHPNGKQVILLQIEDTGIGIPAEKMEELFTAFAQLDGSHTRRYSGTGLGLTIVKRLVTLMGGTLTVDSERGSGTTFYCSLPFEEVRETIVSGEDEDAAAGDFYPLSCLVVEDDRVSQLTVSKLLQKRGYEVVCAGDGQEALDILSQRSFDCLLTDIQMPGMDGMELVRRIRSGRGLDDRPGSLLVPLNLPVVALTAHAMAGDKEHFLEAGMDYYLDKPIIASDLYSILQDIGGRVQAGIMKGEGPSG